MAFLSAPGCRRDIAAGLACVGTFKRHRHSPANKARLSSCQGDSRVSPRRAESFRHFLPLPSPSVVYHGRKPTNLRVNVEAGAAQLQVYGYVVMPEHVHLLFSEPQHETLADRIMM